MDKIEVSQRAREKAWAVRPGCYCEQDRTKWMAGVYDHVRIIQAFARFERDILATRTDATPVATDVAALVEAAQAVLPFMAQMRDNIYIKINNKIINTNNTHHTLSTALAPFTKGQNDE